MKNEEKLYHAIGEIDETLIVDAYIPIKKAPGPFAKYLVSAACVLIIGAISVVVYALFDFLFLPNKGGNMAPPYMEEVGNDAAPDINYPNFDDSNEDAGMKPNNNMFYSNIGSLMLLGRDENKFNFILNISSPSEDPIHVYIYDKEDNKIGSSNSVDELTSSPIIYVDGKEADCLPSKIGVYYINIIFPDLPSEPEIDEETPSEPTPPPEIDSAKPDYFVIADFDAIHFSVYD